jgi:hypothetical protein
MPETDELRKSLENELNQYDDCLNKAREYADLIPGIIQRKKEVEAKIIFLNNAPDDFIQEFSPMILPIQKNDERQATAFTPHLPGLTAEAKNFFVSGSGTSTVYMSAACEAVTFYAQHGQSTDWFSPVATAFSDLADMKSRNQYLPERLDKIQPDLGKMFIIAQNSVGKAQGRTIGVDQAVIQMRDVLQHLWGGLSDHAFKAHPERFRSIQHKQLKKESHRDITAQSLASDEGEYQKLFLNLNYLATLHNELSDTSTGKNPLSDDLSKMDRLYNRWIILLDDISSLVV